MPKKRRVPVTRSPPAGSRHEKRPSFPPWFVALLGAGIFAAFVLGGILIARGDGDRVAGGGLSDLLADDPGPVHVHGLGRNPADGALFIATHTGLYRVANGERKAERVGEGRQDTMGFTIVGPDHFLGSGHPDNTSQPPLLGLIESGDAGHTWESISLLGEADFHVLRLAEDRVYGFDSSNGRLLVSEDTGRTWSERTAPTSLLDIAVNPSNPRDLVASSQEGLFGSADGGRAWKLLNPTPGLLAWPRADRLYLLDAAGDLHVSELEGRTWRPGGSIGGEPAAFTANTPRELYAALHDGTIKRSVNGGQSWTVRSAP